MPSSALLQLVARGRQDVYLTGDPQMTFFKYVFRRYTPFAMESIPIEFDGNADFGRRISCLIPRKADLLWSLFLEVDLPPLMDSSASPVYYWVNDIGHALIEDVSIEIGEVEIDKHTGEWLNVWGELTTPAAKRDGYNEMVGHWNVYPPGTDVALAPVKVTVPLRFWFCNLIGAALPLIALQAHPVRLIMHLRRFQDLWWSPTETSFCCKKGVNPTAPTRVQLFGDYIYLAKEERQRFAAAEHEYLIDQLQIAPTQSVAAGRNSINISLPFNHPCKEFIWVVQQQRMRCDKHEWFNFSNTLYSGESDIQSTDLMASAILRLDGMDRFYKRGPQYFRIVQPYKHHTCVPNNYIYTYSFSVNPEDDQPSGSLNCSKIDDIQLSLTFTVPVTPEIARERRVTVYAPNYNVLRIVGGLGGLAFIA